MQNGLPTFTIIWQPRNRKKIIESGWLSSDVRDAIRLGLNKFPSIDPFDDIAPMTDTAGFTIFLPSFAFGLSSE